LFYAALAMSAFLAVAALVRRAVPWSTSYGLRAKMQAFRQSKDECNAVYIGTSRVYRSFMPTVIDPIVSTEAAPFRSFNLGMAGMVGLEADALLREVLAMGPERLEWVIVELPTWGAVVSGEWWQQSDRTVRWHGVESTCLAMVSLWLARDSVHQWLDMCVKHARLFVRRMTNLGLGPAVVGAFAGAEDLDFAMHVEGFLDARGFRSLELETDPDVRKRRWAFLKDQDGYYERVRDLGRPRRRIGGLQRYNLVALRRQIEAVRGAGARIVFVTPPTLNASPMLNALARSGHLPELLAFNDPAAFPELYETRHRFDKEHLNDEGAVEFSRLFAMTFVELVDR